MAPSRAESANEIAVIDDFELVRNGEGEWLLVLPESAALTHSDLPPIHAELIGDDLMVVGAEGRAVMKSLIAPHFARAMRTDKPNALHVSVVDNDGNSRLLGTIPFQF
jgi:hypothetical protein